MSWRVVVVTGIAKLDLKLGFLVVRREDTVRINIDELHTLIVESTAVSLTAALLNELTAKKVKVIFCDEKRNPAAELIPYYGSHDSSLKIREQVDWAEGAKQSVWTRIVAEKIKAQRRVLVHLGLTQQASLLEQYLAQLEFADATNREGHAAKVYFNAVFGMEFTRAQDTPINAALNYGYSLLLSAFNREVAACGYLTQLGLFHSNRFNPFNLSSDLMEPLRPLVDMEVYRMNPLEFSHEHKVRLVELLSSEVFIDGRTQRLHNAIAIYSKSVLNTLCGQQDAELKFCEYEL